MSTCQDDLNLKDFKKKCSSLNETNIIQVAESSFLINDIMSDIITYIKEETIIEKSQSEILNNDINIQTESLFMKVSDSIVENIENNCSMNDMK